MRGWCTGGAPISTDAENVLLHSLRVLRAAAAGAAAGAGADAAPARLEERRTVMACVVLLRRT
jgi:hypothetical protein